MQGVDLQTGGSTKHESLGVRRSAQIQQNLFKTTQKSGSNDKYQYFLGTKPQSDAGKAGSREEFLQKTNSQIVKKPIGPIVEFSSSKNSPTKKKMIAK